MALRFYATGGFLSDVAKDAHISATKRPVSEAIHAVSIAIMRRLVSPGRNDLLLHNSGKSSMKDKSCNF